MKFASSTRIEYTAPRISSRECPLRARVVDELLGLIPPRVKKQAQATIGALKKRGGPGAASPYTRYREAS